MMEKLIYLGKRKEKDSLESTTAQKIEQEGSV